MKVTLFLTMILCCFTLIPSTIAQKVSTSTQIKKIASDNVRIKKNKPHVFIQYERKKKIEPLYTGEGDTRIWMRLHNNSKWKILFCTSVVPSHYGDTGVVFEVERYESTGEVPNTGRNDTCKYLLLESGKSVLFSVPFEYLADGLAIKIPYRYNWELNPDGSDSFLEPKHYVYFYSEDIPKK